MALALHGGKPIRTIPMPPRPQYGIEERNAANSVVSSGNLSGFLAESGDEFYGGPRVQSLEAAICEEFEVSYAVAMNSATSCLFAAIRAVGIWPKEHVVVTPWSMSASAMCVLGVGAVPVFGDIEPITYGLSCDSIVGHIERGAGAVVLVDLLGCPPCELDAIRVACEENGTILIEDAAQAIGGSWDTCKAGTLGDVGIYSFNRHKTLQCGEGGVAVTNIHAIAERLCDVRNHGEARGNNCLGQNYRMGEIEAAIAEVQLGRLEELTGPRIRNADRLTEALLELDGIVPPVVPPHARHVYYLYGVRVPSSADRWAEALHAEGIHNVTKYGRPLYNLPALRGYARRIDDTDDWDSWYPEMEKCYQTTIVLPHIHAGMSDDDVDDVIKAFQKVWHHRKEL